MNSGGRFTEDLAVRLTGDCLLDGVDGFDTFLVIINEPSSGDGSDNGRVFGDQGLLHEAPGYVGDVPVVRVLLPHGGEKKLLGEHLIVLFDQHLFRFRVEVVNAGHFYTP